MRNLDTEDIFAIVMVAISVIALGFLVNAIATKGVKSNSKEDTTTLYLNTRVGGTPSLSTIPTYVGGTSIPLN